jgi:DNA repair photolyase
MRVPGTLPTIRGRGVGWNPANRFERLAMEPDPAGGDAEDSSSPGTLVLRDRTRSILVRNDSPDVGFDVGINPYRGCAHGCVYCYARPTHEYLGFSAGLDFETKILVKEDAPALLRKELSSPAWKPQVIALSGSTDPYQPAERRLGLTRRCLEVLADFRNPVQVVTKSHLVTRDIDLLGELAAHGAASVTVSITSLDANLQRAMEPRAAAPHRRLDALRALSEAGIPVGVNVAPVVPGLTDEEIPAILAAAAEAGATFASYILLRLPHGLKTMFEAWLGQCFPGRREKVLARLRSLGGGALYDARFGVRGRGEGPWAEQLRSLFRVAASRHGLDRPPRLSAAAFRVPTSEAGAQIDLFD